MSTPMSRQTAFIIFILGIALAFAAGFLTRDKLLSEYFEDEEHPTTQPAGAARQLWTCGMHPQVIQDHPGDCPICHMELTPLQSGPSVGTGVTVDPTVVQNMGVRTTPVVLGSIQREVRVVGYLAEPEPLRRDINLRVRGWIEKLYADTDGMLVEKGRPLFDLYSPEIQVTVNELITARKSLDAGGDEITNQTSQVLYDATARKLELWGLEKRQIAVLSTLDRAPDTVPYLSPITGHVQEKRINAGSGVEAGTMAMRLASRHRMWVDAQVFEQQLPLVKVGTKANVSIVAEPGKTIDGEVIFIHPHLDPQTRTATVRIEIPNDDHRLRQGMYATLSLLTDPTLPTTVVPREAIIDTGTRQVVFVATTGGHFEPRQVKLGLSSGDGVVQVLSGVSHNEQVVTSGQFLIDSESRLKEAIAKHLNEGLAAAKPVSHDHDHGMSSTTMPAAAPPLTIAGADEITTAYLEIAQALGAKQLSDSPLNVDRLLTAAKAAADTAGEGRTLVERLLQSTQAMQDKPLADQRRAFLDVSNAFIAILDRAAPASEAYVFHCPMAFNVENANWVQATKAIANPYYATMMKTCGEVQRTIPARSSP